MTLGDTLRSILPELILLLGAAAIFTVDVLAGRRRSAITAPALALATLVISLLAVLTLDGSDQVLARTVVVDQFALFFKVVVYLGAALTIIISYGYMEQRTRHAGEFYAMTIVAALAMSVAVSANNLILIYLGLEFLSITSYVLAGFLRNNERSNEAGIKYFLFGATSSAIMLYGFSLLYGATGSTDLHGIAQGLATAGESLRGVTFAALILMLAGLGFKTSLVPFHQWTPDTYEGAPTPVAAYLSTASKAAGFAVLVRITTTALQPVHSDWVAVLMALSMISMTVGNLIAIRQTNIKRLLAYSTIAQAGYILIGLVAIAASGGNQLVGGINGSMIYLFAYVFTNIGAWVTVIAVEQKTGSTEIADFAGMIRRSPVVAVALVIFLLSLAGIPPTAVFYGKFFVFGAAVQMQFYALAAVGAINSVISAWYYLNIVRVMFVREPTDESPIVLSPAVRLGLVVTLVMTLLVGIYPQPFIDWATRSVALLAMR